MSEDKKKRYPGSDEVFYREVYEEIDGVRVTVREFKNKKTGEIRAHKFTERV